MSISCCNSLVLIYGWWQPEIRRENQLRLVVYSIFFARFYTSQVVVWDFFHQQYVHSCVLKSKRNEVCVFLHGGNTNYHKLPQEIITNLNKNRNQKETAATLHTCTTSIYLWCRSNYQGYWQTKKTPNLLCLCCTPAKRTPGQIPNCQSYWSWDSDFSLKMTNIPKRLRFILA